MINEIGDSGGRGGSVDLGIHMTYPRELAQRTMALESETPTDNRMSWGCINISEENFIKYLKYRNITKLYISPDDPNYYILNPETGKLELAKEVNTNIAYVNFNSGDN